MLHEPAGKAEKDHASDWKAKLGIKLTIARYFLPGDQLIVFDVGFDSA